MVSCAQRSKNLKRYLLWPYCVRCFPENLILEEGVFICKADARFSKDTITETKIIKIVSRKCLMKCYLVL